MKCIIERASISDNSLRPHDDAYWDANLNSWCINIVSMEHLISIMQRFPECVYGIPEALISVRPLDKMLSITIHDEYFEE